MHPVNDGSSPTFGFAPHGGPQPCHFARNTVKRKAAAPMLVSIAVPYAERLPAPNDCLVTIRPLSRRGSAYGDGYSLLVSAGGAACSATFRRRWA
jgi:hypothetical protein